MSNIIDEVLAYSDTMAKQLDRNPLLTYEHLPGKNGQVPGAQEQFHNCTSKIKALFGGNRAGKSHEGAEYTIVTALATPKGRGWAVAPSNELSIEVQQRKIWDLVPKDEIAYGFYDKINGFRHGKLELKNGFVLIFKAYEQGIEKFQSDDVNIIWLDEEPPYSIYQECLMRIIDRVGQLVMTLTPLQGFTKFVDEVFLKKNTKEGATVSVFMLDTEDNVYLNTNQLSLITSSISEDDRQARLRGVPVNKEGLVYPMWKDQYPWVVTVDQWNKIKDRTTRYASIDPHSQTPSAVGFYGIDRDGRFWLFDELFDRMLIPELARRILEKEGGVPSAWRVIDTSAQTTEMSEGKTVRMQMFEKGVATVLAKKDHKNTGSIALLRQMLTVPEEGGLPMFVVVENCTRARFEFLRYSWASYGSEKAANSKDPKQEVKKKDDHMMDNNHYIIRSYASYQGDDRGAQNFEPAPELIGAYEIAKAQKKTKRLNPLEYYKVA